MWPKWYENDRMWALLGPIMFTPERWEAAGAEISQILSLLDLQPPGDVLDLGCGAGRHSLELARRGFGVTGVDRTAVYLEEARERAAAQGLAAEFLLADMRQFVRPESFDAALSMYTSFGYFEDPEENQQVLENVCRSLRPGGQLVMELMGKEILARIFQEKGWQDVPGGFFLQQRNVSDDWSQMDNRWVVILDGQVHEFHIRHWIYAATELAEMLRQAGFDRVALRGGLDNSPYDRQARRLVAIATK